LEQVGQIEKGVVAHVPGVEQVRVVPGLDGGLRDGALRQVVLEVRDLQSRVPWGSVGGSIPRWT
jgi:hypothetical protein